MAEQLLGNFTEGSAFIISAPAGTGKTTLVNMLVKAFPTKIVESVSYTTRAPREGEIHGVHYFFVTKEEFEQRIANNEFLEYVQLYGYYYGTSRLQIETQKRNGKHVILVIDTQGALQLKKKFEATYIFIAPPSLEVLQERLKNRKTECAESFQKRISWAQKEIALADQYDYTFINDDLTVAYQVLLSIIIAAAHKIKT